SLSLLSGSSASWLVVMCCPLFSSFFCAACLHHRDLHSFPTRRSSDLRILCGQGAPPPRRRYGRKPLPRTGRPIPQPHPQPRRQRSEEHTSELQSRFDLVCRLLLEKKKNHCCDGSRSDLSTSRVDRQHM